MTLLKDKGLDDVQVVIGGIIPDVDLPKLNAMGITGHLHPRHADAEHRGLHYDQCPLAGGAGVTRPVDGPRRPIPLSGSQVHAHPAGG